MRTMDSTRTELILDRAYSAVISMDEAGVVTYWNPSAESTFGIERSMAVGRQVADLIIPERFRAAHWAGLERFLAGGAGPVLDRSVEMAAIRADGTEFPVEMTISALRDGERWTFHAFLRDISALKDNARERDLLVGQLRRSLRRSEARLDAIVGELSDPVTIRDRQHRFVYANRAALAYLGFESWEALRDTSPSEIMADYLVWGEDGGAISMDDIPSVRILRGEPAEPLLIRTVNRQSGQQRWNLLKAAPLLDDAGEVEATIMIIEDVTEQKRAERQGAFLSEVSDLLASSLDHEQTLRNVARLAVPDIADWCAVDLFDRDGGRQPVAVAHVNPDRLKLAEQLRGYEPEQLDPDTGLGLVFRTGQSLLYENITDEMLVPAAVDERHLELLREVGFRSVAIVPMRLGRRILGAMTLVSADSGRMLDRFDLELAQEIAARAAVAIENSRLYTERSTIAHTLQQSLLPEQLPQIDGYELASLYVPALQSSDVGGDFYDVWQAGDSWMLTIGDVTGKGVEAAALTSLVRYTMRAASDQEQGPAALLGRVDAALKKQTRQSICTALCARLHDDKITVAVGGHPLPLYISAQEITVVGVSGPLLGGFSDVSWPESTFDIEPGCALVSYTDGVTDALGQDGTRYGLTRLQEMLAGCDGRAADTLVAALSRTLEDFETGERTDDTAALVLTRGSQVPGGTAAAGTDQEPADAVPAAVRR
jgi:PAS domain S-box-containing protein